MQYLKKDIREKIIAVATEEFIENGFEKTSMRTIASNAGVALGNVYRYFSSKENLYDAIAMPYLKKCQEFGEKFVNYENENLLEIADKLSDFVTENKDMLVLIRHGSKEFYLQLIKQIASLFAKGIRTSVKEKPSLDFDFCLIITGAFLHSIFSIVEQSHSKLECEQRMEDVIKFYFAEMGARFN